MSTDLRPTDLDAVADAVRGLVDEAFDLAARVEAVVAPRLAARKAKGETASRADLADVEEAVTPALTEADSRIQGAGFVAAVALLDSERWWLEWFLRSDARPTRLEVETDEHAMGFHDYERLAWYAIPRDSGARTVTGPYVDNLCTEDYTLTFTQPVLADGAFVGVAGADIGVRAAERALLPVLRAVDGPVAVVNAEGRVLVSNTGSLVCGELLEDHGRHRGRRAVPDVPLEVVGLSARTSARR